MDSSRRPHCPPAANFTPCTPSFESLANSPPSITRNNKTEESEEKVKFHQNPQINPISISEQRYISPLQPHRLGQKLHKPRGRRARARKQIHELRRAHFLAD